MEVSLLLLLLLPVAATSGWYAARYSLIGNEQSRRPYRNLTSGYLQGLNYLLTEQPDKAIDVFLNLIDVNNETIETYLALGTLFRRRGEVNRAIRIHQNLVNKKNISYQQRSLALLELAQDHQRAGLLDRAEELYRQLLKTGQYQVYAYRQLLDIYQQERDWEKAILAAKQLAEASGENLNSVIAHHYCEQAEQYCQKDKDKCIENYIQQALHTDPHCVRASLMSGRLALKQGRLMLAIQAFRQIEKQDPAYLPEVVEPLGRCYQKLGKIEEFVSYLHHLLQSHGGITPMLALAKILRQRLGNQVTADLVVQQLRSRPSVRGLAYFLDIVLPETEGAAKKNLLLVKDIMNQLLENKPIYTCSECGFQCKTLYWQCPSCKHWSTVKPIQGIDGE